MRSAGIVHTALRVSISFHRAPITSLVRAAAKNHAHVAVVTDPRQYKRVLESLIAAQGPGQDGFLGSTRYGVLADPDVLVEIADWESAEARDAHMKEAAATGAYAPLLELLAAPFRVTVISQLP